MKQRKHRCFTTTFVFLFIILAPQVHESDALKKLAGIFSLSTLQGPRTPEELQAALDAASDGDIIDLLPISYVGDFILQSRNPADKITIRGSSRFMEDKPIPVKKVKKPWFHLAEFPTPTVPQKYSIIKNHTRIVGKEAAFKLIQGDWTITFLSIESGGVTAKSNGEVVRVLGVPTTAVTIHIWESMKFIAGYDTGIRISMKVCLARIGNNNGTASKLKLTGMTWEEERGGVLDCNDDQRGSWNERLRNFNLIVPTGHEGEQTLFPTCNALSYNLRDSECKVEC
jgi:hypothetical protein